MKTSNKETMALTKEQAVEMYFLLIISRIQIFIERVMSMKKVVEVVDVDILKIIKELTFVRRVTRNIWNNKINGKNRNISDIIIKI